MKPFMGNEIGLLKIFEQIKQVKYALTLIVAPTSLKDAKPNKSK
jgi:hypothetical protein